MWVVGAAGATNTQGLGGPLACTRGIIPKDQGNKFVIAVEAMNNGTGETWPDVMLRSYVGGIAGIIGCLAEQGAYDISTGTYRKIVLDPSRNDLHAHFEWAPTRKIDPAGPPADSKDPGYARMTDQYKRWNMNDFRTDVAAITEGDPEMKPLPKPQRAYDSRNTPADQALVDPILKVANKDVPLVPMAAGERRAIAVGGNAVHVHLTVISDGRPGWAEVSGTSDIPTTSLVNFDSDGVESAGGPIACPTGKVYVYASTACNIAVDVRAR